MFLFFVGSHMNHNQMEEETIVKGVDDYHPDGKESIDIDSEDEYQQVSDGKLKHTSKIFIGNLPFTAGKTDLEKLFGDFGLIIGVNVRSDRVTGKPKGFAFVTFENPDCAQAAIRAMNGFTFQGRALKVSLASLRGQNTTPSVPVDDSWKTVPAAAKSKTQNKQAKKGDGKEAKPVRTWDQWAGPLPSTPMDSKSAKK